MADEAATGAPIRLLVCDIDGTLVRQDKSLADATVAAFARLRAAGVHATLISARPPSGILWLAEALGLPGPLGAFNGGTVFMRDAFTRDGSILSGARLDAATADRVLRILDEAGVDAWLFARGCWYARDADNPRIAREALSSGISPTLVASFAGLTDGTDKIVGVCGDAVIGTVRKRLEAAVGGTATVSQSHAYFIDVTCASANKGVGVAALAAALDIPLDQVAAIGDMENDLAMFSRAGLSVAMGQAPEPIKAAATFTTASNEDDGVAMAIDRFVLPRAPAPR